MIGGFEGAVPLSVMDSLIGDRLVGLLTGGLGALGFELMDGKDSVRVTVEPLGVMMEGMLLDEPLETMVTIVGILGGVEGGKIIVTNVGGTDGGVIDDIEGIVGIGGGMLEGVLEGLLELLGRVPGSML